MSVPESVGDWIALAEEDLLNIENNLSASRVPWSTVCFHAQQGAEKYLKAVLITQRIPPPRIHDLLPLLTLCTEAGIRLEHLEDDCFELTRYAVAPRYPGLLADITETDAQEAVAALRRIRQAIRPLLGLRD
jgi:HEPN domain-containing protein